MHFESPGSTKYAYSTVDTPDCWLVGCQVLYSQIVAATLSEGFLVRELHWFGTLHYICHQHLHIAATVGYLLLQVLLTASSWTCCFQVINVLSWTVN